MSSEQVPRISLSEFLELEATATYKSEYWDGQVFAMAGGTYEHALIASNLIGALGERRRGQPCRVIGSDLLVEAAEAGLVTYPDVLVICGEPQFVGPKRLVVSNPVLVVEVLSPSTEGRDRGRKATQYRKNRTLQQYVLVATEEARVEVYTRGEDGSWSLREWSGMEAVAELASVGCVVPLGEVYAGVIDFAS